MKALFHKYNVVNTIASVHSLSAISLNQVVVVPDSATEQKVPDIDGLMEYREDKQELYLRLNKSWNALALKKEVFTGGCQKKEPPSKMANLVYKDYK